ncbi:MAG: lysylphosphatidylglycerol synthase domain-containing protein [Anaerolineae bacterium]
MGLMLGTFTVLGFLIARDWNTLWQFRWHLRPSLLILALGCHAASLAGIFIAWRLIMARLGSPVGARIDFHIYFLSVAARKIPSAIWYAGTRLLLYSQEGVRASLVLNAIALEFGIAVLTGGWVFIAFQSYYAFMEDYAWVRWGVSLLTVLLTGLFLVRPRLLVRWIRRDRRKREEHFSLLLPNWGELLACALVYFTAWVVGGTSFYLTIRALILDPGIDWINAVGVATLSTLVVLVGTVLPVGIGLKELAAGVLLSLWLPMPVGLSVAVVYRILQVLDEALWVGVAYFLRPKASEQGSHPR